MQNCSCNCKKTHDLQKLQKVLQQYPSATRTRGIPGDGACELLISMSAPKRAFRVLSKYFGQRTEAFK